MKNMTEGRPLSLILGFAVPLLIGNIFQQFYNLADAAIVGRYVGQNALAAVGATGSTNYLLISLVTGLMTGASIIMSQLFGHNDVASLKRAVASLIHIVAAGAVVLSLAGLFLAAPLMHLLKTPDNIINDSIIYLKIVFAGIPAMLFYNGCASVLRSLGDSRTPLYALIVCCFLNIGMDVLLVVKFGLGVVGVAAATLVSQLVSGIICFCFIAKKMKFLRMSRHELLPDKHMLGKICRLGIPTALQSSLISLGNMSVQSLVNSYGAATVAAYTASGKIDSIAIQYVVSVGGAMSVFSGQNMGAARIDRIKKGLKDTLGIMLAGCLVIAAGIFVFREPLLGIFLDVNEAGEAVDIGKNYLGIVVSAYFIAGIMQSFLNLIRGAGDVNASMLAGIVELSARVAFSYIFAAQMDTNGIWLAIPVSWGCACVFTVCRYFTGKWKGKGVAA